VTNILIRLEGLNGKLHSRYHQTELQIFIVMGYTVADYVHARLHAYILASLQPPWAQQALRPRRIAHKYTYTSI
jgi:hypothetical protein